MPTNYRLEARLTNAMTKLSGVDWCIPHHVKKCDYDLIRRLLDVTIRDSLDGAVTRFFSSYYRDDTPSQFILATLDKEGNTVARRIFDNCEVVKHRVRSTVEHNAMLKHRIVLRYENLTVQ